MPKKRRVGRAAARACGIVAVALAFYALVLHSWLSSANRATSPGPGARAAEAALGRARQAFRENFLDPRAHLRLSEALFKAGRPIDAFYVTLAARQLFGAEAFGEAHALVVLHGDNPDDATAAQARLLAARGDLKGALAALDEASAAQPDSAVLLLARAQITNSAIEAIPYYARAAAAAPRSYEGRAAFKALEQAAQKPPAGGNTDVSQMAGQALEEIYQAKPNEPRAFTALANVLLNGGDVDRVRALIVETRNRNPRDAGASQIEGMLALLDKKIDEAAAHFAAAWEADPNDLVSAAKLAQIYDAEPSGAETALPFYLALYRFDPDFANPEPIERRIREILDARRIHALQGIPSAQLRPYLASDDASLRAEACERAAAFKDRRWIDDLGALLDDDTEIVRHDADYALYQIARSAPAEVRARRDAWLSSEQPLQRARALNLFSDLDRNNTFPLVQAALDDPNPTIRFWTKALIFDRYYANYPPAAKVGVAYLKKEKDPGVLALYAHWRMPVQIKP